MRADERMQNITCETIMKERGGHIDSNSESLQIQRSFSPPGLFVRTLHTSCLPNEIRLLGVLSLQIQCSLLRHLFKADVFCDVGKLYLGFHKLIYTRITEILNLLYGLLRKQANTEIPKDLPYLNLDSF